MQMKFSKISECAPLKISPKYLSSQDLMTFLKISLTSTELWQLFCQKLSKTVKTHFQKKNSKSCFHFFFASCLQFPREWRVQLQVYQKDGQCRTYSSPKSAGVVRQCWHDELVEVTGFLLHLEIHLQLGKTDKWKLEAASVNTGSLPQNSSKIIEQCLARGRLKTSKQLKIKEDINNLKNRASYVPTTVPFMGKTNLVRQSL